MASGLRHPSFLENSILCSKEYITDDHITLPHGKDGEMDYSTLGNILTAKLLEECLYVSYVDKVYGEPEKAALLSDLEGWKFFGEEKEVQIFKKCYSHSPLHGFAGRCVIDVPMQRIAKVISDLTNRHHYDQFLVEIRDVLTVSDVDYICYIRHEAKRCLFTAKRDFCFYERRAFKGGRYTQAVMSVEHQQCPLVEGVIRGKADAFVVFETKAAEVINRGKVRTQAIKFYCSIQNALILKLHPGTGWILEPYRGDPTRALVTFVAHIDLRGMPALIINRVLRREPLGLAYLKKFIMSMDAPAIPLSALSSITNNFNASLSSSLVYSKSDSPDGPTIAYMKSPDLATNKPRTTDELFYSALQSTVDEPQDTSTEPPEVQLDVNNCNNTQPQTSQVTNHVKDDTSHLLVKTHHYVDNLANAGDVTVTGDGVTNEDTATHSHSVQFTISTGSDLSSVYNSTTRDVDSVVISTGYQLPAVNNTGSHDNKTLQSGEEPQLPINEQFDIFVSL